MQSEGEKSNVSRRDFLRFAALASGAGVLAACTPASPAPSTPAPQATGAAKPAGTAAASGGVKGGTLRAAIIGEPPSIDPQWTTATVTANVTWHAVEALFTLDSKYQTIPMLAESMDTSSDGLTRTIKLRKGVLFHNNKEMTSDDVEASILRWSKISGLGKGLFARVDSLTKPDKYTVVFKMKSPYAIFDVVLGLRSGGAAIMPKEIVDAATEKNQISQLIGTGPYKFVEQQKDRYIRFARWEQYQSNGTEPNLAGGKKNAYFDEIRFIPVPDQTVRVQGIQAGDYDYAEGINTDQYPLLKDNKQVTALVSPPSKTPLHYFNNKSKIMSDQKLRQAILAAVDPEAALKAAWATTDFYRISGALMQKEGVWYTEAGTQGKYNQKNMDAGKALLKDSKYKGETIRYMTTKEYPTMYQEAVVVNQQLQALGLKTDLQVLDWATLVANRAKEDAWEMFTTWHGFVQDPSMMDWNNPSYPGWWTGEKIDALRDQLVGTLDYKGRFAIFEKLQTQFYEDVPLLKLGDVRDLYLTSPKLKDVNLLPYTMFWNAYLTK